ncbi:MAG: hypothetical protein WEB58_20455 [Planctomycetaceae bacterium]
MSLNDFNRRDFHRLTLSALGGMFAGAAAGCSSDKEAAPPPANGTAPATDGATTPAKDEPGTAAVAAVDEPLILQEPHVCRGLNTCKGKGKGGDNACAGQGSCATAVEHTCAGANECKGQGGCGKDPGQNSCKGEGGCNVPLMESIWDDARTAFEKAMKAKERDFGAAPAA